MRLAVLGHSNQAVVAAAWASMAANGAVTLAGDFASNEPLPTKVMYDQSVIPCRIDRVQAGDPIDADEATQDAFAAQLYAERGSAPWPSCAPATS